MGKVLDEIGPSEEEFISKQKVFFVGTAPLSAEHHVNVSPKAPGSSVKVLGPHKVAYADLTGSGSEAAAHVLENQRMCLMFCNLEEGPPKIVRLHGKAEMIGDRLVHVQPGGPAKGGGKIDPLGPVGQILCRLVHDRSLGFG